MAKQKISVPKRLAGVKIPKPLRSSLRDLAASRGGKVMIADSLAALSVALATGHPLPAAKLRPTEEKTTRKRNAAAEPAAAA